MPRAHRADARDPRVEAVQRPGLAVRDQVGRLPGPGGRRATARSGSGPATCNDAETYFPRLLTPPTWIDASEAIVDGEVVALDEDGRPDFALLQERLGDASARRGLVSTRRSTCSTSTAARCSTSRSRTASGCSGACSEPHPRVRFASTSRARGWRSSRRREAQRPRGRSSPSSAARATSRAGGRGLAEAQDPARAGARRRRLDARRGQRAATSARWSSACTRTASCASPARSAPGSTARRERLLAASWPPLATDEPPFDPPPPQRLPRPLGRRPARRPLGPAGARHPRRARRLDARRDRPPGRVQGHRGRAATRRPSPASTPVATTTAVREAEAAEPGADAGRRPTADAGPARDHTEDCRMPSGRRRRPRDPDASVAPPPTAELAALDALGKEGIWKVGGNELKLTNLDKPLFDGATPPVTKRELIRYFARIAPTMLPHLADRPLNLQRFPNGAGRARASGRRTSRRTAPAWLTPLARDRGRRSRGPRGQRPPDRRSRRDAVLARQPGQLRDPRLDRQAARSVAARRSPTSTSTRATRRPGRRPSSWPGCTGRRSGTSASAATRRRPASAASRSGSRSSRSTRSTRRATGSSGSSRAVGATVPGPRLVGVGEGRPQGPRPARLHPEREHQDARRAVRGAARGRRAGVRADRLGRARRPGPAPRPLDDPDDRRARGRASATCSRPPRPTPRSCRASDTEAATPRRADAGRGTIRPWMTTRSACGSPTPRACTTGSRPAAAAFGEEFSRQRVRLRPMNARARPADRRASMASRGSGPAARTRSG